MGAEFSYERIRAKDLTDQTIAECKNLFQGHYGKWGSKVRPPTKPGNAIRAIPQWKENYLSIDDAWISIAKIDQTIIGYATAVQVKVSHGTITWVTQLVVHEKYRKQLVGSKLLHSIWGYSEHYAWGIASANPYAIRALEKVTRRRCIPSFIKRRLASVTKALDSIPYLKTRSLLLDDSRSIIDTDFFQDISTVEEMIANVTKETPWNLGRLSEGQEWLAATFKPQQARPWSSNEFEEFQHSAESIVKSAYEHMSKSMREQIHNWAKPEYAEREVKFLIQNLNLQKGQSVLDIGCGNGRHSAEFAKEGFSVVGVDSSQNNIEWAKEEYSEPEFCFGDARNIKLDRSFDIGVCLYDVIGSYVDDESNEKILHNLASHVNPNGYIVVSVMSLEYSLSKSSKRATNDISDDLLKLIASKDMQQSGEVFGSNVLIDTKTKITYRKENFDEATSLPEELIVRDRRYDFEDLRKMFSKNKLEILHIGYISAGHFEKVLDHQSQPNKEILVIAKKGLLV